MDDMGVTIPALRDNRYDAIIHMTTAADGAEQFYGSITNEARYESKEEAIEKDKKIQEAYMNHAHFIRITNAFSDFDSKIKSAKENVHNILGIGSGNQFFRKYLVKNEAKRDRTDESTTSKGYRRRGTRYQSRVPINLPAEIKFEQSKSTETFLKNPPADSDGRQIIEQSVIKEGIDKQYNYTLKQVHKFQG